MKKIFLIPLFAMIAMAACKKDIQSKYEPQKIEPSAPGNCTGNTWSYAASYIFTSLTEAPRLQAPLIYNNKAYIFAPNQVKMYDGTSWSTISSATPVVPVEFSASFVYHFGFTIGNKGYLGFHRNDLPIPMKFYEYDFLANTWQEKAEPPFGRALPATFTIGNRGYCIGGESDEIATSRWTHEYDPATDTWTKKADIPAITGRMATGFSIGDKGYIVNGESKVPDNVGTYTKNLFQYDPLTNQWQVKANFPGAARTRTAVFVISGIAYAGGGSDANSNFKDFYKYNPQTNSWIQIASMSAGAGNYRIWNGFTLNSKGYVTYNGSLYKYTPGSCNSGGSSQ